MRSSEIEGVLPREGLTSSEVAERRKRFGANKLPEKKSRTPLVIYLSQFRNPLIYVISAAALISVALAKYEDALIIALVIILDSVLGFFQEYRAEKTVAALRRLLKPIARVFRDSNMVEIEVAEIVPDDIVAVNSGDKIPADGELIEAVNVSVNEAILTGESESVAKQRGDKVFMGTTVLSGRGLMKVISIGSETELGKVAGSLGEIRESPTPLQIRLESFGKSLTYIVIITSTIIFALGILSGADLLEMLHISVVLAIAAIPEGLPIAVTMILVIGMRAILQRKGLVKRLLAVETLGSVTVICTDKTGTLTEGVMQVARTDFRSEDVAVHVMALCNNLADSLEVSLWESVRMIGFDPKVLSQEHKRVHEVPFTSENKYMLTVNTMGGSEIALLKGAPETVLEFCNLGSEEKEIIVAEIDEWASSGLKLIALASKQGDTRTLMDFTWVGLVGIEDPVRPSVKDTITLCHKAGIKVKIVTGDYRGTAEKVASAIGLTTGSEKILEGKDLDAMTESELAEVIDDTAIFCRVSPHHKLKIVRTLQSRGEITAMIGDGVNDAPALKKANIGVTVGNATDIAQETSSIILLDSNFGTLVNAVEEGRIVFDNIKKVVAYVLSNSFAEIFTIFGAMLLRWPAPVNVAQILWIHLICDGPSDIALGFEKGEKGIMEEPPTSPKESVLGNHQKFLIFAISLSLAILSLLVFQHFWQAHNDIVLGRTIVFTVLAITNLVYIFSYRSFRQSALMSGKFFSNKMLFGSVALGFAEQLAAIYIPSLNKVLDAVPLQLSDWGLAFGIALSTTGIVEVTKYITRHWRDRKNGVSLTLIHN